MNRLVAFTAVILVSLIVPTSINSLHTSVTPVTDPTDVALSFIRSNPTFSFDGIDATLKVVDSVDLKSNPVQHVVTLSFSCLSSGYGNRAAKPMLQVITPHIAIITVVEGQVTNAVYDDQWDELNQQLLPQTSETVTKIAVDWLRDSPTFKFDGVAESLRVVEVWQAETFAYPSFWQVTAEFDALHGGYGDRTGQILAQVITHHSISIHVTEGRVTMAIIDEKWNELAQSMLPSTHTPEEAQKIALGWLYLCPTFKFDGINDTVKVQRIDTLRMPNTYDVYIGFVSGYPGYGDRTGHVTYGHSQQHIIKITVQEGSVTRAVIDDVWDEVNQKMLNTNDLSVTSPESARDYIVAYLLKTYNLGYANPITWATEDLTPKGLLGSSTFRYSSGSWSVTVKYPIILMPTYTISLICNGSAPFTWEGSVGSDGSVTAEGTSLTQPADAQRIYGPIEARDICVAYILLNHTELQANPPSDWSVANLVPEGIMGATKLEYSGGGWDVIVSGPVVWKPTYSVDVSYTGLGAFKWSGMLPQGGPVQELTFSK
jgi:hypothetical protein